MKRTILAAAIALATAPAFATVTAYDNAETGVKVNVSGDAEVQYFKGFKSAEYTKVNTGIAAHKDAKGKLVEATESYDVDWKNDPKMRLDDGDIQVDAEFKVSDQLTALSTVAFKFEDSTTKNDELTVGLKYGNSTIKVGRQTTHADDYGISEDVEFGYGSGFDITEGEQVIKYTYANEGLGFGVSYLMNRESTKYVSKYAVNNQILTEKHIVDPESSTENEGNSLDLYASYEISGLTTKVFYNRERNANLDILKDAAKYHNGMGYENYDENSKWSLPNISLDTLPTSYDVDAYGIEATYVLNDITLAAGYTQFNYDDVAPESQVNFDKDVITLAATYTMDNNKFAIGYDIVNMDGSNDVTKDSKDPKGQSFETDTNNLYANVTHTFNKNVKMYAEVGYKTYDSDLTDLSKANSDNKEISDCATTSFDDSEVAYVVGMEVKF